MREVGRNMASHVNGGEGPDRWRRVGHASTVEYATTRAPVPGRGGRGGGDDGDDPLIQPYEPGNVVGRYHILRALGPCAVGVAHAAREPASGRVVTLKLLGCARDEAPPDPRSVTLLTTVTSSHPSLEQLLCVGRSVRGPYVVTEALHGRTLADVLAHDHLAAERALRIAGQLASGLAHAHASGIPLRDLTPATVLLLRDGRPKLLDVGLAWLLGWTRMDGAEHTFVAPEQLRGEPGDERSDVFALGTILYRLLAGRPPFPDHASLRSGRVAQPVDVPGAPAVGLVLARMLDKSPERRLRDGGAVLAALLAAAPDLR